MRVGFRVFSGLSPFLGSGQDKQKKLNRANTNVHFNLFVPEGPQKEFYFVYLFFFGAGLGGSRRARAKATTKTKNKKGCAF